MEAPDLVIEILSEGTKTTDRTAKKTLYEQHGAREYWIIDPKEQTIDQFILQEDTFDSSQSLTSPVLEGFILPIDKVFVDR